MRMRTFVLIALALLVILVFCAAPARPQEKTFTVRLGIYDDGQAIHEALIQQGFWINESAERALRDLDLKIAPGRTTIEAVIAPVGDFKLPGGGSISAILESLPEHHLKLCPIEVGPMLRLQYTDQPLKSSLIIPAEQPMRLVEDFPFFFALVSTNAGLGLGIAEGDIERPWRPEDRFVFCR